MCIAPRNAFKFVNLISTNFILAIENAGTCTIAHAHLLKKHHDLISFVKIFHKTRASTRVNRTKQNNTAKEHRTQSFTG